MVDASDDLDVTSFGERGQGLGDVSRPGALDESYGGSEVGPIPFEIVLEPIAKSVRLAWVVDELHDRHFPCG